ncbi:MAG: hypothetical protein DRI26_00655 [Chloroflexi bacterium]|nr:MAG: hypothetical protein DRI26_00655 [Chloroflexota bacterium]
MNFWEILGAWVGAFFVISVLTMLWKDNPYFRFGQQAIIGATIAHYVLFNMKNVLNMALIPISKGNVILVVPLILGLLMYTRLSPDHAWFSKYPTSVLVGVGIGVMIAGTLRGQIIDQVKATVVDIFTAGTTFDLMNGIIIAVGTVTAITFWLFTREHKGALGASAKIGRIFLMVSLGTNWAGEEVWYLTQIIGRLIFLINVWIKGAILGMA